MAALKTIKRYKGWILLLGFCFIVIYNFKALKFWFPKTYKNTGNCYLSVGSVLRGDVIVPADEACFEEKAILERDWRYCSKATWEQPCLNRVIKSTSIYLCDKGSSIEVIQRCNRDLYEESLFGMYDPVVFAGIEKYKTTGSRSFLNMYSEEGSSFTPFELSDSSFGPRLFGERIDCRENYEKPYRVQVGYDEGAYVFLTSCKIENNRLNIKYYKYVLDGIRFPKEI